jgi:hypothetical protein
MIRRFALQNVERAPNSIARMMTRIYYLSWDEIAFFDISRYVFWRPQIDRMNSARHFDSKRAIASERELHPQLDPSITDDGVINIYRGALRDAL